MKGSSKSINGKKYPKFFMTKWFLTSILVINFILHLKGQKIDSQDTLPKIQVKIFTPIIELVGVNATVNRINYWLRKEEWANVNPTVWRQNLKTGFRTDGDRFSTNFFGHPTQGSWYYNAARSSGYNYWQSAPQVAVGSLIWEFFCENEPASEIDINTTTFGGIQLGEITHKLSRVLLSNHKNRKFKIIRSAGSIILDPMGSLNSLMFNDVKKYMHQKDSMVTPIRSFLSLGANLPYDLGDELNLPKRSHIRYHLIYGNLFQKTKYRPFDFFNVQAWVDMAFSDKEKPLLLNINSYAPIARFPINNDFTFTISQHYDFLNNHIFDQGDMSLTSDLFFRKNTDKMKLMTTVKAGVILFGSTSSEIVDYLKSIGEIENNRSYVYGNGFSFETDLTLDFNALGTITLNHNIWFLRNKSDIDGWENSSISNVSYSFPIAKNHSFMTEFYNYTRKSHYSEKDFTDTRKGYSEFRLALRYVF